MANFAAEGAARPLLPLYHLVSLDTYSSFEDPKDYVPPTHDKDGFIHLTEDTKDLLDVANQFYKGVPGEFLLLELDPQRLIGNVVFEPAAPVGNTSPSSSQQEKLFPHLYGKICKESIISKIKVLRNSASGEFLEISYPVLSLLGGRVLLGTNAGANDLLTVKKHNISAFVCVAPEGASVLSSLEFGERMSANVSPDNMYIEEILSFMENAYEKKVNVLVYSAFGRERCVAIAVAYLMYKSKMTFKDALQLISTQWPRAKLGSAIEETLVKLENTDSPMQPGENEPSAEVLTANDVQSVVYLNENANLESDEDDADESNGTDDVDNLKTIDESAEDAKGVVDMSSSKFTFHGESVYAIAAAFKSANAGEQEAGSAASSGRELILLSGGGDDVGYVWKPDLEALAVDTVPMELKGHTDSVASVSLSCDGGLAATGSLDGTVMIWDTNKGTMSAKLEGPGEDIEWINWHPKGAVVLAGSTDSTVWMWTATGRCMQVFSGHEDAVTCGQFLPNGKGVVTGCGDGSAKIWAPKSGKCRHTFDSKKGGQWHTRGSAIVQLAVSNASDLLLTGSIDGTARLAHIQNKKILGTLPHRREGSLLGHTVEAVDFSTILPWCVTGGSAGLVKVWDLSTLATRHEFKHDAGVIKAKFVDSHAQIVVTCSVDQSIRIWDARTGNAVRT